jgi:hypothetical protein
LLEDKNDQHAVEVAERFADGLATDHDLLLAHNLAPGPSLGSKVAEALVWSAAGVWLPASVKRLDKVRGTPADQERRCQANLLRDLFGGSFQTPAFDSAWVTPQVRTLAQTAYDKRALPSGHLDPDRLGVLADALEDGGCTSTALLAHLRSGGEHVRGCFALDLVLGKE